MPTPAQIASRCGGFNCAKELAGLVPNRVIGKTFDDEEIRQALLDCAGNLGKNKFSEDEYTRWRTMKTGKRKLRPINNCSAEVCRELPKGFGGGGCRIPQAAWRSG